MTETGAGGGLLDKIFQSIVAADVEATARLVGEAVAAGVDVMQIVEALTNSINTLGAKFEALECFLPELILGANAMEKAMAVLRPELERLQLQVGSSGTVVMANIQGDIHDIGRDIVVTMLRVAGLKVHDLGHDVKSDLIIDKAMEYRAEIIGLSSLLTTSLPYSREVLSLLEARGLRNRFKVIMGGGAVTPEYCRQVGADGYAENAAAAVNLVQQLLAGGAGPW